MEIKHAWRILLMIILLGMLWPSASAGSQSTETETKHYSETETKHVVLIHGAFHGAWCWYKVTTLLKKKGYTVAALDMTSQGINKATADNVTSIAQFVQPAVEYLDNVTGQVVVVGHSLGGAMISYLMERYGPAKIAKAVFLAAVMPRNNQSALLGFPGVPPEALPVNFGNGLDNPPTSLSLNQSYGRQLFYGSSPDKDVVLAYTLLVPNPYAVLIEPLHLTPERYGEVRRYYIITENDTILNATTQELFVAQNPPQRVFRLKNSDHSAFFSAPLALTKVIQIIDSL